MKYHRALGVLFVSLFASSGLARTQSAQPPSEHTDEAPPANIGGGYHCSVALDSEEFGVEFAVYQSGSRLRGSASGEAGEFELTGSVSGNIVSFLWYRPYGGRQIPFRLTGEIKGDVIEGTADLSSIGKGTFTAERFMK